MLTHTRHLGPIALLASIVLFLPVVSAQEKITPFDRNAPTGEPPPVPTPEEGAEVQGRGPVHEGFAQPNEPPQAGPLVAKAPPEPIPELPPEQRPEGDNVVWVPGYWAFDDDRGDFIWVSGFWRVAPNGRKWVPGYWAKSGDNFRWVGGFWAPENAKELPYLDDAPPESIERGPSVPPPAEDYVYSPGVWVFHQTRYVWQPGVWYRPKIGFVWCPPRWCWTPRGFLFVSGFWDRCLESRGILFAPVFFSKPLWKQRGWFHRPVFVVPPKTLVASLWIRPRGGHYAYGDFYGAKYGKQGFQPWAVHGARSRDPLFGYYRWANRDDARWQRNLVSTFEARNRGTVTLPPRTLAAQQNLITRNRTLAADLEVARPIARLGNDRIRLTRQTQTEQTVQQRSILSVQKASLDRQTQETRSLRRGERAAPLALDRVPALPRQNTPETTTTPNPRSTEKRVVPNTDVTPRALPKTDSPKQVEPRTIPRIDTRPKVDKLPKTEVPKKMEPRSTPKVDKLPKTEVPKQVEPRSIPRIDTRPKVDKLPKTEVPKRVEPRPIPKVDKVPKVEVPKQVGPRSLPRTDSTPKVTPRKVEPQSMPAPKVTNPKPPPVPRHTMPAEPKRIPTQTLVPKSNPAPRVGTRSAPPPRPQVQSRPAPRVETRSAPAPRSGGKPSGGNGGKRR